MNSRARRGYFNIGTAPAPRVVWHGTAPMDLGVLEIGAALASAWA